VTTPVVALAASTGGPAAITHVLRDIHGLDVPVLIVQHIGSELTEGLAAWMERTTNWPVRIAQQGMTLDPGVVLMAPAGWHLTVGPTREVLLDNTNDGPHRPSANRLFRSLAHNVGHRAVAALLTGMGDDGADGLLAVSRAGGVTIAQDEKSSTVFGMAKAAIALGAVRRATPLAGIGPAIIQAVRSRT
jgi:two-component system chemotaxis response regulator CheB